MQNDTILRTVTNGEDELWYSGDYIKKQIELAYLSGLSCGANIELHMIQPMNEGVIPNYTNKFWAKINEEYTKKFNKGFVWNISKKQLNN